ncbi:MAG: TIM44-like domain-containing protein, partial [Myxococcales bacterium]|nr:TIM44-like domain-containing protein [Myxococcales bacterium]
VRLIWLCVYYPAIGIPLTIGLAVVGIWAYRVKKGSLDWDSAAAEEQWKQEGPGVQLQRAVSLERVRKWDPDFSPILFEDFAYRLYATCHEARHDDAVLAGLAPYVADAARQQLAAREPRAPVTAVIVGAMRPIYVTYPSDPADPNGRLIIGLEFESNYTVQTAKGSRTYYAIERWKLARASAARTKPKDLTRGFPCPNCGAPWQADQTHDVQRCAYCGEVVDNGRFDWQIVDVQLVHSVTKPPTLTNDVPERGTNLPTYRQDGVDARWNQLIADDPALDDNALMARITMIYAELYAAWAKNDLSTSRPYVSDGLHDYLTYWILAYKQQGLRNCLEDMRITHSTLAKITRDRWYDAVTIRIWGTGKDYVIREADGHRVRGSKTRDRPYSEYWTVIRSAARRGPARAERVCGNCGAPAQVGMNGACEHCGAHVTNGEFDWVLSKIEQDDTYRG